MNVSIIMIHWNTRKILEKQLDVLTQSPHQIIVIDNASDKPIDNLQKKISTITFIQNKYNRGFAFACNQGAIQAKGEWLLFLNPDVEINEQEINQLRLYAEKNDLDAVSPDFEDKNYRKPVPTVFSLLCEFTPLKYVIPAKAGIYLNRFRIKSGMTGNGSEFRTLTGGCLLIKKEIFFQLGGFDERFFLWFEDSDLTKRLIDKNCRFGFFKCDIKHSGGESFKNLDEQYKRDIFFNSMEVYGNKHFSRFGQQCVKYIKRRYSRNKLLPAINKTTSIVVPNMRKNLLDNFFKKNKRFFSKNDEYIIVSSAIKESNVWSWRARYPMIRFIPIIKNQGVATTVNIGFRTATGDVVGTVNDDTVLNNEWVHDCLVCIDGKTGSINPIIYTAENSIESAGIDILLKGKALPRITSQGSQPLHPRGVMAAPPCFNVDATNAAAVLYSKEALNKVGLFDENFGSYLEDIDLSLRLKRAGYRNIVSVNASIMHDGQQTSKLMGYKKNWFDFKNWIWVIVKNWSLKEIFFNFPQIFVERIRNISGVIKSLYI